MPSVIVRIFKIPSIHIGFLLTGPLITVPFRGHGDPLVIPQSNSDKDPLITLPCFSDRDPLITDVPF